MKKGLVIIAVLMLTSCGKNQERPDNGHDYDWEWDQSTASKHSVDCRKCKEIRYAEIKAYVDSVLQAKGL
jgi:hypothetical protein